MFDGGGVNAKFFSYQLARAERSQSMANRLAIKAEMNKINKINKINKKPRYRGFLLCFRTGD